MDLSMVGIKAYFRCMFRALRDIHARGIIHRDVKPANFLFDPRTGIGTLCDFGLASVRLEQPLVEPCSSLDISEWTHQRQRMVHASIPHRHGNFRMERSNLEMSTTWIISKRCKRRLDIKARGQAIELDIPRKTSGLFSIC